MISGLANKIGWAVAGLSCCFAGGVAAQEMRPASKAIADSFFEVMNGCIDWLIAGATDDIPFSDWETRRPFPTPNDDGLAVRGTYFAPIPSGATVSFYRTSTGARCDGSASWIGADYGHETFNAWALQEVQAGRLQVVDPPYGPDGDIRFALCLKSPTAFLIWQQSATRWNFVMNTEVFEVPEGVCL